jgi:hypothetical protein
MTQVLSPAFRRLLLCPLPPEGGTQNFSQIRKRGLIDRVFYILKNSEMSMQSDIELKPPSTSA